MFIPNFLQAIILFLLPFTPATAEINDYNRVLPDYTQIKKTDTSKPPKPGSISFLDYKNGFRDIHFGDKPKALSENRVCRKNWQKHYICIRQQEYKPLVSMKIYGIEYTFKKVNDEYLLAVISIDLVEKTNQSQHEKSNYSGSMDMLDPEAGRFLSDVKFVCDMKARQLTKAWGKPQSSFRSMTPTWEGEKVTAYLNGLWCETLIIKSNIVKSLINKQEIKSIESDF